MGPLCWPRAAAAAAAETPRTPSPAVTPQPWSAARAQSRSQARPQVRGSYAEARWEEDRGAAGRLRMRLAARQGPGTTPSLAPRPLTTWKFKNKGCGGDGGSGPPTHLLTAAPSPTPGAGTHLAAGSAGTRLRNGWDDPSSPARVTSAFPRLPPSRSTRALKISLPLIWASVPHPIAVDTCDPGLNVCVEGPNSQVLHAEAKALILSRPSPGPGPGPDFAPTPSVQLPRKGPVAAAAGREGGRRGGGL